MQAVPGSVSSWHTGNELRGKGEVEGAAFLSCEILLSREGWGNRKERGEENF